jgi:NAD(P)-dependent dehydrogenase (short-subunit alcohol dehydrogenase family)
MTRLAGKVAIITGASAGIGECTAERFAREGAAVVVTARREDRITTLAERIAASGGQAVAIPGDVRSVCDVRNVVEQTIAAFGRIDILVSNAGIVDRHMATIRVTDDLWDDVISSDLTSVFYYCREVLPHMVEAGSGAIVNVSSIAGKYANGGAAYSAAKAGVAALTMNIAMQYSGTGIRCNAVLPGPTPTELNTPERLATFDREFREITARHTDMTVGASEPIDQANAILFLASDEARYITGQLLVVDRGMCL